MLLSLNAKTAFLQPLLHGAQSADLRY